MKRVLIVFNWNLPISLIGQVSIALAIALTPLTVFLDDKQPPPPEENRRFPGSNAPNENDRSLRSKAEGTGNVTLASESPSAGARWALIP